MWPATVTSRLWAKLQIVQETAWFSSPGVMFPVCDPGRARAASTSSWPRPRRTATPWTRAAACSPASQRWCITTAPSGCLSTAPSTWPCCTQCLASTDSTLPRCTNQTHLWAWVHGQQDFKMMTPHNHQQKPPFFFKSSFRFIFSLTAIVWRSTQHHVWTPRPVFFSHRHAAEREHLSCLFACEQEGATMLGFGWSNLSQRGTRSIYGNGTFFLLVFLRFKVLQSATLQTSLPETHCLVVFCPSLVVVLAHYTNIYFFSPLKSSGW